MQVGARLRWLGGACLLVLAACVDQGARPAGIASAVDSADQLFIGFQTNISRDGVRRAQVSSDTARLFETSQSLSLKKMRLAFFDAQGAERSKLTADSAQLTWTSNLVLAYGHVVLSAPDGRTLRSEFLRIDDAAREISTDKPFTLDGAGQHVAGTAFKSDPEFKNMVAAKPRGYSGKPIDLPGQN